MTKTATTPLALTAAAVTMATDWTVMVPRVMTLMNVRKEQTPVVRSVTILLDRTLAAADQDTGWTETDLAVLMWTNV